jgi:hypothetical protein
MCPRHRGNFKISSARRPRSRMYSRLPCCGDPPARGRAVRARSVRAYAVHDGAQDTEYDLRLTRATSPLCGGDLTSPFLEGASPKDLCARDSANRRRWYSCAIGHARVPLPLGKRGGIPLDRAVSTPACPAAPASTHAFAREPACL